MSKLLCYELNEVPWRVIDLYTTIKPDSELAKFLDRAAQFTTHTVDSGELHPWSTWPTVHRGVSNEVHKIHYLNQDLSVAKAFAPVWEILVDSGRTCGIFGSLQSYPPVEHKNMAFHIPDTFAAGSSTIPDRCEAFQAFNLLQTGENKAVAGAMSMSHVPMALGLARTGIKPTTYLKVAKHLLNEKRNALYKSRRALLQPELAFDVFLSCLKRDQPDYVTFFSNHVAGIMHRYWKYSFPEDFDYELSDSGADQFHRESIVTAMDLFDDQLAVLVKLADRYSYDIILTSSMGQEAIERGEYVPELKLSRFEALKSRMQIDFPVTQNLAMQPDVAFEFDTEDDLAKFQSLFLQILNSAGEQVFKQRFKPVGNSLNLSLRTSKELVADNAVYVGEEKIPLKELGLELVNRDIGTGYHQPEGMLIWQNFETQLPSRTVVDSRRILPSVLAHFELPDAPYMQPAIERRAVGNSP